MPGSDASVAEILHFLALKWLGLGGGSAWLQAPLTPEVKAGGRFLSQSSVFTVVLSLRPLLLPQFLCSGISDEHPLETLLLARSFKVLHQNEVRFVS